MKVAPVGTLTLSLTLLTIVDADLYMHHPRGSNNKLNEVQNNVRNANRLFDSQNNNAGGYQVGDNCVGAPGNTCHNSGGNYDGTIPGAAKGQMYFYEGSLLNIEWTNQHGCGDAQKNVKCELIMQYMCEDTSPGLRDGTQYQTTVPVTLQGAADPQYGVHEPLSWYTGCQDRERNKGLYIADQNLGGNRQAAINTRQNSNGERHGYECTEERDYYPYWHPTPWRDIAIFTDDQKRCAFYQRNSQNVRNYGMCCNATQYAIDQTCVQQVGDRSDDNNARGPNNPGACAANTDQDYVGAWVEFGAHRTDRPLCERTPFARDNHLGNSVPKADEGGGLGAVSSAPSFTWEVPRDVLDRTGKDAVTCVLRMRYNISTTDFDGWDGSPAVDSVFNGDDALLKGDPKSDFLGLEPLVDGTGTDYRLKLNINTAQYGRTFQDRSHTFQIRRRRDGDPCKNRKIFNLGVRGRRGNIVQVYPAVEYDFVPTKLSAYEGDCIHFQWTGSDANPNNAGNGNSGTDRSNIVEQPARGKNVPARHGYKDITSGAASRLKYESMFRNEAMVKKFAYLDQELNCTSGTCVPTNLCDDDSNNDQALDNCAELNAAAGYFDAGPVVMDRSGTFNYMSTRNNDFTNRSQKGTIIIIAWKLALALGLSFFGLFLLLALIYFFQRRAQFDPEHRLHRNVCGRCLVATGQAFTKYYEKSPLAFAPRTVGLVCFCGMLYAVGIFFAVGGDPAPLYIHAKGFGRVLDIVCNLVFLPVLRNFTSWLRTTPVADYLGLGEELYFHKLCAVLITISASGHITCHYYDYWWHKMMGSGRSIWEQALFNWTGVSGHLIAVFMLIMFATATEKVRRGKFTIFGRKIGGHSVFVRVHKLWIPVLLMLWTHSRAFWHYSLTPTVLLIIDKLIGRLRGKVPVELVEAYEPTKDVMGLQMRLRSHRKFRYKSGQYLFLHCPAISTTEWHPFTISSSPEERTFSVHIRCRSDMDWTYALKQACLPDVKTKAAIDVAREKIKLEEKRMDAEADKIIAKEVTRRQRHAATGKEDDGAFSWLTNVFGDTEKGKGGGGETAPLQGKLGNLKNNAHKLSHKEESNSEREHPGLMSRFGRKHKTDPKGGSSKPNAPPSPPPSPPGRQGHQAFAYTADGNPLELFVDGPYGTASEEVFGFEVLVLVGAGIGVTPFASILKTLAIQAKQDRLETPLKKVAFYWVCRDDKEFETFRDLLVGIVDDSSLASIFELNTYITGEIDLKKVSAKQYGYNQFAGRPDWNRIGKSLRGSYPEADIGVFLCGPAAIGQQLSAMCTKFNPPKLPGKKMANVPRFFFHKENF